MTLAGAAPPTEGATTTSRQRVVVLGGGPAGDVAALRAAQLGAAVTLVERAELGGTCLNWGCIPTKALLAGADLLRRIRHAEEFGIHVGDVRVDFARMMARKQEIVEKMRAGVEAACKRREVTLVRGHGVIEGDAVVVDGTAFPFDHLIVCTGTAASGLPGIDMDHARVVTSDGILMLEEIPQRMVVIGGGVIGCEFASLFAALGTKVTVVEVMPQILTGIEPKIVTQFRRLMEREGVVFHTGAALASTEYSDAGITATLKDGTVIDADLMLVSVGRRAQTEGIGLEAAGVAVSERGYVVVDDYLLTANPKIRAAGDCIGGLQLAHLASAEAHRAVENALLHNVRAIDRTVVPSCIYTHPEIATVGLSTDQAKAAGHEVHTGQARYAGNGKALAEGESDGVVQLVADKVTGTLLGATLMGAHAVEMIHEIGVAISDGLTIDELGDIIHAHPTISELIMDAAQVAEGVAPYIG